MLRYMPWWAEEQSAGWISVPFDPQLHILMQTVTYVANSHRQRPRGKFLRETAPLPTMLFLLNISHFVTLPLTPWILAPCLFSLLSRQDYTRITLSFIMLNIHSTNIYWSTVPWVKKWSIIHSWQIMIGNELSHQTQVISHQVKK